MSLMGCLKLSHDDNKVLKMHKDKHKPLHLICGTEYKLYNC